MGGLHRVRWAPLIGSMVDNELDQREIGVVLEHLEHCRRCLFDLDCLVRMKASLARLPAQGQGSCNLTDEVGSEQRSL